MINLPERTDMMHHVLGGYFKLPSYSDFAEDMIHQSVRSGIHQLTTLILEFNVFCLIPENFSKDVMNHVMNACRQLHLL